MSNVPSMRIAGLVGGEIVREDREISYQSEHGDVVLVLNMPLNAEYQKVVSKFRISDQRADWDGYIKHVARHWVKEIKGARDENGNPVDTTSAHIRELILNVNRGLWLFVIEQINAEFREVHEGNGDSGTDS